MVGTQTALLSLIHILGAGELEAVSGGDLKGWVLMTVDGFSLGFAKADRGVLKNHYPKGLRRP